MGDGFAYAAAMKAALVPRLRLVAPWVISALLLAYVFGAATDWERLVAAIEQANGPLFVALAAADRLGFFAVWTWLQAEAMRRFVVRVPYRSVIAMRGGSELLRSVSNPLSDAAFFLGLTELAGGRFAAVVAAIGVPVAMHFVVMLLQMTLALPFIEGGIAASRDVLVAVGLMWSALLFATVVVHLSRTRSVSFPGAARLAAWIDRFRIADVRLFFYGFVALAVATAAFSSASCDARAPW